MSKRSAGFTLIEIAIVLVIIGLLIGGMLAGQQLIRAARVRNLIAQQDSVKVAFLGFQDRYRELPGDYSTAAANINCTGGCADGDGNGRIEAAALREDILVWSHLSGVGLSNGSYTAGAGVTAVTLENTPQNLYNSYLQIAFDGLWGSSDHMNPAAFRHSVKTGNQIPVEIIAEVDRKIDDGSPYNGSFQFSSYSGSGNPPDIGGTFENSCADLDGPTGLWNAMRGQSNCGGASLL